MSSKDVDEERVIHSKVDNIKIMINDRADDVVEELFEPLRNRYQSYLEKSMKNTEFLFDFVHLL